MERRERAMEREGGAGTTRWCKTCDGAVRVSHVSFLSFSFSLCLQRILLLLLSSSSLARLHSRLFKKILHLPSSILPPSLSLSLSLSLSSPPVGDLRRATRGWRRCRCQFPVSVVVSPFFSSAHMRASVIATCAAGTEVAFSNYSVCSPTHIFSAQAPTPHPRTVISLNFLPPPPPRVGIVGQSLPVDQNTVSLRNTI